MSDNLVSQPDNKTILQNLRDFTVQIRRPKDDAIVGTGIAVSLDGRIVTCAHVVKAALGVHPRQANGAEVGVYFPQARGDETKARQATVAGCFPEHDDDVVLLQLDGPPPLNPEQMPKLGTAEPSAFHPFRSYGFRRLAKYLDGHAHGTILAEVTAPPGLNLHAEPVQVESKQINQGMSGAGVLDVERNLVVGIVSEFWRSPAAGIDQGTAWAVNGRVLSIPPMDVTLQDEPLPKRPAAQPQPEYKDVAQQLAHVRPESQFHNAPPPLAEWVGRAELLEGLNRDYTDPERRVTGLIGFGGEGKSSIARRWVDSLTDNRLLATDHYPDGVFWWGFYDNSNVDEFFEAALRFISGGAIDPRRIPSSSAKAQVVAAMLANGRYLFVLDGLEVLQRQEGDRYGLLNSPDLNSFLELFAAPGHESFCLVTSRAPLLDLMAYSSYNHRGVGPVSVEDGRALLRALDVKGRDDELDKLVAQWDGHALTLSLLGSYLAWRHGGNVAFAAEFDPVVEDDGVIGDAPDEARRRYAHVHRVLRRYDEHLSEEEQAFMTLFSAFRTPVAPDAFERVFRARPGEGDHEGTPLQGVLAGLDDGEFEGLVTRLVDYWLLRHNETAGTYTTHPLVRSHYLARLTSSGQAAQTHEQLKDYYLALAGDTPQYPTLEELAPLIEVVYHACRAGAYDEAYQIRGERITQGNRHVLVHQLGAYETQLAIMQQFFPNGDASQEPLVSMDSNKSWILNEVGFCLMSLGRLDTAVPFYERRIAMSLEIDDLREVGVGYRNLADLNANLGRLSDSATAATQALELAYRASHDFGECQSMSHLAFAYHLQGEMELANDWFQKAEKSQQKSDFSEKYLYSNRGIFHAEHLWRVGDEDYARRVTDANLEICELNRWPDNASRSHSVLGDLDAADGQDESARAHYDVALTIARGISERGVLIQALLARGWWVAHSHGRGGLHARPGQAQGQPLQQAFSDLREALGYATDGGYRIYEADIRIGLAWAHLAADEPTAARQEADRARTMSQDMGYHWGQVDADEVLATINS